MKIFHNEKGKDVVYVQMNDILYLIHETDIPVSGSIFTKAFPDFTGMNIVTDKNRFDFVRFEDSSDVKFFKKLDFILDFDQYKNLTDAQLEKEIRNLEARAEEIAKKWNKMTKKQRRNKKSLYEEHRNINYIICFLLEVYDVVHGRKTMPFPKFVKIPNRQ